MSRRKLATDHRALVLESVATSPQEARTADVVADCAGPGFTPKMVKTMLWQLRREGLVGVRDYLPTPGGHFLTAAGLAWLRDGRFDRALPPEGAPRLRARKRRAQT